MDKPYFQQLGERIRINLGDTLKELTWMLDLRPQAMADKHQVKLIDLIKPMQAARQMGDLTFMQGVLLWLNIFEKEGITKDDLLMHNAGARNLFDFADEYQEYLQEEREFWTFKGLVTE